MISQIKEAFSTDSIDPQMNEEEAAKIRARVRRYMGLARHMATWSKDPSTKVGCVVVGRSPKKISLGYNGFPTGIADTEDRLSDKDVKYRLTQHAERNALDNAEFDVQGCTLVTTLHPCIECAKSIVSRGIRTVVTTPMPIREPWKQSAEFAAELFKEAGVEVVVVEEVRTVESAVRDRASSPTKSYFKEGGA